MNTHSNYGCSCKSSHIERMRQSSARNKVTKSLEKVGFQFGFTVTRYEKGEWINNTQGGDFVRRVTAGQAALLFAAKDLDEAAIEAFNLLESKSMRKPLVKYVRDTVRILTANAKNQKSHYGSDDAFTRNIVKAVRARINRLRDGSWNTDFSQYV